MKLFMISKISKNYQSVFIASKQQSIIKETALNKIKEFVCAIYEKKKLPELMMIE